MDLLLLLARLVLAGVFVISAVAKLLDRSGSRAAVLDFGVPATLAGVVASGLPVAELLCAGLLVSPDPGASAGAWLSVLLLASFTLAIVVNLVRGRRPDCHCFGQLTAAPLGWTTVARNAMLLVLALLPLSQRGDLPSVAGQLATYPPAELALGLLLGSLALAVIVLGALFRTLMSRYGAVLLRLEALESSTRGGVQQLVPAPVFDLPDLNGERVTLEGVLGEQRPVLLVFISPNCKICAELLPDLLRWQTEDDPLAVLVLSVGTVDANRAKLAAVPDLRVLLQGEREISGEYGLQGTPGAFLIGVDGLIAAPGAYGIEAIRELHESVVAGMSPGGLPLHGSAQALQPSVGVGDPVPPAMVETEAGQSVDLVELIDEETVLLFWDTNCGFCSRISAQVAAMEAQTAITLVSRSDPAQIRASGLTSALVNDRETSLRSMLQIPGTPAAVFVSKRAIASEVAVGGLEVLGLLERHSHSLQS